MINTSISIYIPNKLNWIIRNRIEKQPSISLHNYLIIPTFVFSKKDKNRHEKIKYFLCCSYFNDNSCL
jgi:hypothetical protein